MMLAIEQEKLRYLYEHEFFQDFSHDEMQEMEKRLTMFTCPPGRLFYSAGETGEVLFILKEGMVHLYLLTPEGRKLIVATLTRGAVFGEMSLIGQGMQDTFAEAATPARICVMSRIDVENLLLKKPRMALQLLSQMGRRLKAAEEQLEQVAFNSVSSRLAVLLLRLATRENLVEGFTHQELAEMVGTYRETATTILNEFRAAGLIAIGRKQIQLLDREQLELYTLEPT